MIGALIGDIAAWTYEHDKDTFFSQMIPDDTSCVVLSDYGNALLKAGSYFLLHDSNIRIEQPGNYNDLFKIQGQWLMWNLVCVWDPEGAEVHMIPHFYSPEKEEEYSRMFLSDIVTRLLKGETKSEVFHNVQSFEWMIKSGQWKNSNNSLLTCIFRAWDAFYRGFDFTSTIHNAMKYPGDRHLIAMIAGTFADAMYGCEYNIIKKNYAPNGDTLKKYNLSLFGEQHGFQKELISSMRNVCDTQRHFFPKNWALTNVEKHKWSDCFNPFCHFEHSRFTEEEKQKIMLAGRTGWDNRYGIYLDDGWFYCYRSGTILLRFKLAEETGHYEINELQLSDERNYLTSITGLLSALYETCRIGFTEHDYSIIDGLSYCLFLNEYGQISKNKDFAAYEGMELMYYTERFPKRKERIMWENDALTICLDDPGLSFFMKSESIPLAVKGMLAFSIQDILYHSPMGGGGYLYGYAKVIAKRYGVKYVTKSKSKKKPIPETIIADINDDRFTVHYLGKYMGYDAFDAYIPDAITGFPTVYLTEGDDIVDKYADFDALDITGEFYE